MASVSLFRRLTWEGTVPLEISVDARELPAGADRALDAYYIQAPRVSYLPLLLPDIRTFLAALVLPADPARPFRDEDWWFSSEDGTPVRWHYPLGLLYDLHAAATRTPADVLGPAPTPPMRLILHLAAPPTDRLLVGPTPDACKQAFMGQLKEADFLRWGTTKRVTGLRKQDQDGLWESIRDHDFDAFWRIAAKITPTPSPAGPTSIVRPPSATSQHTRPASTDPQGLVPDRDGAYAVRSVPLRIFLPYGPVLQDLAPPMLDDATPNTLDTLLRKHIPLLYLDSRPIAYALVQGVVCPLESELGWLGACLVGADGWINICIGLGTS